MAKHNRSVALRSQPVVIAMPRSSGRARRVVRATGRGVRRVGRGIRSHGHKALPVMGVTLGAAVVGYLQGKGMLEKLPQIGGSRVLTLGLAGYAATRFIKNPHIRQAGLAALAAAAFDFGRVNAGGTSGIEGDAGGGPMSGAGY